MLASDCLAELCRADVILAGREKPIPVHCWRAQSENPSIRITPGAKQKRGRRKKSGRGFDRFEKGSSACCPVLAARLFVVAGGNLGGNGSKRIGAENENIEFSDR
jgi:hypothetical protein